jgi:hypothetical protein
MNVALDCANVFGRDFGGEDEYSLERKARRDMRSRQQSGSAPKPAVRLDQNRPEPLTRRTTDFLKRMATADHRWWNQNLINGDQK